MIGAGRGRPAQHANHILIYLNPTFLLSHQTTQTPPFPETHLSVSWIHLLALLDGVQWSLCYIVVRAITHSSPFSTFNYFGVDWLKCTGVTSYYTHEAEKRIWLDMLQLIEIKPVLLLLAPTLYSIVTLVVAVAAVLEACIQFLVF